MARRLRIDQNILEMALLGFQARKAKIDIAIADIEAQLNRRPPGRPRSANATTHQGRRGVMSAAGRERIAAAQRKRWAALKATRAETEAARPKRKLSAAGRKAIAEATRRRWAAWRKSKSGARAT